MLSIILCILPELEITVCEYASGVQVTDSHSRCVSSIIWSGNSRKLQQNTYHLSHLLFPCSSIASHSLLDLLRRILGYRKSPICQRQHRNPTRLPHSHSSTGIFCEEKLLYCGFLGVIEANDLDQALINLLKSFG